MKSSDASFHLLAGCILLLHDPLGVHFMLLPPPLLLDKLLLRPCIIHNRHVLVGMIGLPKLDS